MIQLCFLFSYSIGVHITSNCVLVSYTFLMPLLEWKGLGEGRGVEGSEEGRTYMYLEESNQNEF